MENSSRFLQYNIFFDNLHETYLLCCWYLVCDKYCMYDEHWILAMISNSFSRGVIL